MHVNQIPITIAALQADVGDASAGTLASLYGILGNPAQTFNAMVGYEGATALASKLTAARAALLDGIARQVPYMDFWSDVEDTVTIPAVAADLDFPNVVVAGLPSGAVLTRVICILKCRAIRDSSGAANAINGVGKSIRVKKSTGAWNTDDVVAINFDDNQWAAAASAKEAGDVAVGDNDVKSEVDGNATYNFRSEETNRADAIVVDGASLVLHDVQMCIRVYFLLA